MKNKTISIIISILWLIGAFLWSLQIILKLNIIIGIIMVVISLITSILYARIAYLEK